MIVHVKDILKKLMKRLFQRRKNLEYFERLDAEICSFLLYKNNKKDKGEVDERN